ncbi:MAG: hypothetical protein ACI9RM_002707 [Ulvibacter sp.]|jgi:hypothetical protein
MNANEPSLKYRENEQSVKTVIEWCSQEEYNGDLTYWLCGRRYIGGMISI